MNHKRESSLHESIKAMYAGENDQVEAPLGNYYVDVYRNDMAIEIQTGNFSALRQKLSGLLNDVPVLVVYPLVYVKYIVRVDVENRKILSSRKSPRQGSFLDLFSEIVYIPEFILHPNFSLEVLMVKIDEFWVNDGSGSWRRKYWSITDRKLREIIDRRVFRTANDYRDLVNIPAETFDVKDVSKVLGIRRRLASRIVYTMRRLGVWQVVGKRGNAYIYQSSTK